MYQRDNWVLNCIEEAARVSEFLFEEWVAEDPTKYTKCFEQAKRCPDDVVQRRVTILHALMTLKS